MSTADIVGLAVIIVLLLGFVLVAVRIGGQRRELRLRFGDEYDRTVEDMGGAAAAEAELRRREREHARLQLKPLSEADRKRYGEMWQAIQAQFVDDPAGAVNEAERLIASITADRGYPVADFSDRVKHLSVEHARALTPYRAAHEVTVNNQAGRAATEELRLALVNYREIVADLVGSDANGETVAEYFPHVRERSYP
jgi:hypothetical protein